MHKHLGQKENKTQTQTRHTYADARPPAHTRAHTRTHTRARTHTQAHARTHTHTHAHTRTRPPTEPTYARHMILHIKFDANMWFDLRRQYNASVRLTFVTPELKFNYYGCMYQSAG